MQQPEQRLLLSADMRIETKVAATTAENNFNDTDTGTFNRSGPPLTKRRKCAGESGDWRTDHDKTNVLNLHDFSFNGWLL